MTFKTGQCVEVRSKEEILRTLDATGSMDHLPFMPEMLRFCGRRFRVQAVAHKTCDTVSNQGGRRMRDAVHLEELRCDGSAHGGCQAACLLFFKNDWLRKVDGDRPASVGTTAAVESPPREPACSEATLMRNTQAQASAPGKVTYSCQATRLPQATAPLAWWDVRQYVQDVLNRNVTPRHALRVLVLSWFRALTRIGFGYRLMRRLYERVHVAMTGLRAPDGRGQVPEGVKTPSRDLNLTAGEWIRVRPFEEILQTLNRSSKNRGLWFDDEMTQYCGQRHRVLGRVERIINEKTGEMMHFQNPCIVLDGVNCTGSYTRLRLLCPRRVVTYWREIWLDRAEGGRP